MIVATSKVSFPPSSLLVGTSNQQADMTSDDIVVGLEPISPQDLTDVVFLIWYS